MKIMTIGEGFVSSHLPYENIKNRIEIDSISILNLLDQHQPDVLINCTGKTGRPNIDWCESHKEETAVGNIVLPIMLAEACTKRKIRMIQINSGCIYFGKSSNYYLERHGDPHYNEDHTVRVDSGWKENDFANPQSYYSQSKYACDLALAQMPYITTLRIRMPISDKDHPRNLINKLRGYNQIINTPNSMTFMSDLIKCIDWLAYKKLDGIFHVVNPQPITPVRIMRAYQKYVPDFQFESINEQQLDKITIAKRSNCILSIEKLQKAGFKMTNSEEALEMCMADYIKNIRRNNVK